MLDKLIDKIIEKPEIFCIGLWVIGFPIYVIGRKMFGFTEYRNVWTTTEFKKQFKRHQIGFNEEFKEKNKKMF